jgi:hypothetical protein
MTKKRGIPVSERAVVQRINRKFLSQDGPPARELKKTRGARALLDLGDFYVLNTERNFVEEHHIDIEDLAREMGVLNESEYLFEETGS